MIKEMVSLVEVEIRDLPVDQSIKEAEASTPSNVRFIRITVIATFQVSEGRLNPKAGRPIAKGKSITGRISCSEAELEKGGTVRTILFILSLGHHRIEENDREKKNVA